MDSIHEKIPEADMLFSLGDFYTRKGNYTLARDLLSKLVDNPYPKSQLFFLLGQSERELKNVEKAVECFEKARTLNPFHKQTLVELYRLYIQNGNIESALSCIVDLYLLSKELKDSKMERYRQKIRKLVDKMDPRLDTRKKNLLIRERNQKLNEALTAFEKSLGISQESEPIAMILAPIPAVNPDSDSLEKKAEAMDKHLAAELDEQIAKEVNGTDPAQGFGQVVDHPFRSREESLEQLSEHLLFKSLDNELLEKIRKFSSTLEFKSGETIYQPQDLIYGFNCILDGKVEIRYQGLPLMELERGSMVDEAELCMGSKYFFETKALEPTRILIVDKAALLTLCKRQHELAYHFLWHFYKSLSLKVTAISDLILELNPSKDTIADLDFLNELSSQRSLTPLEVHILEKLFHKILLKEGSFLFKSQSVADKFYILLEGNLELKHAHSGKSQLIQSMQYFSEIGLMSSMYLHAVDAVVKSPSAAVLSIDRDQLAHLYDPDEKDSYRLTEILWKIFSWKYFEFMNFHFQQIKSRQNNKG